MDVKLDLWDPSHESRLVDLRVLPTVYESLSASTSPVFTWNDGGDDVLIVSVGDEYCTVSMLTNSTWFYLMDWPNDELAEIDLGGQNAFVPRGAILPRRTGLEVLLSAHDFPRLLVDYSWTEQ